MHELLMIYSIKPLKNLINRGDDFLGRERKLRCLTIYTCIRGGIPAPGSIRLILIPTFKSYEGPS